MANPSPKKQRLARARLDFVCEHAANVFAIHYACDSLGDALAPRITSIAVQNLADGTSSSFSLYQEAELAACNKRLPNISDVERTMLKKFFAFMQEHRRATFLHWKMNSTVYGFAALEDRYALLGGTGIAIPHESQRVDLALVIEAIYGTDYAPRPHTRSLAEMNGLSLSGYIDGDREPTVFRSGDFKAVMNSSVRKAALLCEIAELARSRELRTSKSMWQLNVGRVREAAEFIRDNPLQGIGGLLIIGAGVVAKFVI
jgi:hypothetical protein